MVRVLLILRPFNLSDEQMQYQLLERLGFQRFWVAHEQPYPRPEHAPDIQGTPGTRTGASESIFDALNRQLSIHGDMARGVPIKPMLTASVKRD